MLRGIDSSLQRRRPRPASRIGMRRMPHIHPACDRFPKTLWQGRDGVGSHRPCLPLNGADRPASWRVTNPRYANIGLCRESRHVDIPLTVYDDRFVLISTVEWYLMQAPMPRGGTR